MATSGKKKLIIGAAILALLGAGGIVWWALADSGPDKLKPPIAVPAENVRFHLVPPGKEERSGLYAMAEVQTPELPELFGLLADGKVREPVAGKPLVLVGKLPGTVYNGDFFQAGAGSIEGRQLDIPVKFVWWAIKGAKRAPRAAYFTVTLPALPAGKYRVTVAFKDYEYTRDKAKITESKRPTPRFKPLTCEFEVKPQEPAP